MNSYAARAVYPSPPQENKSSAVGGGPLAEMQRLTVCSADPTTPHQSGTSAMIP